MKSRWTILSLVLGIILIVSGIVFSDVPRMIASQGWPTAEGQITRRRMVGTSFEEYDGDVHTELVGYIRYQYQVGEEVFSSTTLNSISSPSYDQALTDRYPRGKEVLVYYNPRNPAEAVLEPGWIISLQAFGLFSAFMLLGGIYLLVLGFRTLLKPA